MGSRYPRVARTWPRLGRRVLEEAVACRACRRARRDTLALPCAHFLFCGACLACAAPLSHRQLLRID